AAPAEFRMIREHRIYEIGTGALAGHGDSLRAELAGQPALERLPGAIGHGSGSQASPFSASPSRPPFSSATSATNESPCWFSPDLSSATEGFVLRIGKGEFSAPLLACCACCGLEGR